MNIQQFNIRILPRWIIITIDVIILFFSSILAFLLRFNLDYSILNNFSVGKGIIILVFSGLVSILFSRSYAGIVRYTGIQDAKRIFSSSLLAGLITVCVNYLYELYYEEIIIPLSVVIITFLCSTVLLYAYRIAVKQIFQTLLNYKSVKKDNIAIFGTDQSGMLARQIIESQNNFNNRVAVYFDLHKSKIGKVINGVKVFDFRKNLQKVLSENEIKEIIIAERNLNIDVKNNIVDECLKANVKIRTIPPVEQWIKGSFNINQIKEINIEELLGRESIKLDNQNVREELKGKSVMVTGAAGSIGRELVRQVLYYCPKKIIMVDQAESPLFEIDDDIKSNKGTIPVLSVVADITNIDRMDHVFKEHQPDVVYHAAAYKHVPMMENNVDEAVKCNIEGTMIVSDLSVKYKTEKFVMISTDKAVNPTSVMGASKRIAEMYVQSLNNYLLDTNPDSTKFITTRFGNVLGSNGSVIPLFKRQIQHGGPVTVTHPEITRYFMTIPEACQLVLEAGVMGNGGEIFVFDMGKSVKIVDLAKKMIKLSGFEPEEDIEIVYTGLRAGEKLYEELLSINENTIPTYHHKIMIAKNQEADYGFVKKQIQQLISASEDREDMKVVGIMKYLAPEFKSNYSKFEVLDKEQFKVTS